MVAAIAALAGGVWWRRGGSEARLIVIGLDGADWQLLDDYVARGLMPNLAQLAREGRAGVLTTQHPPLSPLVWTTMVTGVSPLEHRILDFTRFNPLSGAREPITSAERRAPALWDMVASRGESVAVFGLWATYPAEDTRGLVVSDRLCSFQDARAVPAAGLVFPAERGEWAREALARAERETNLGVLRAYLPWLDQGEYDRLIAAADPYAHPVTALRRILVETRVYSKLAREWIAAQRPNLAFVYLQGTDTIGHVFAPYVPPRLASVAVEDFDRYHEVPERYFAAVDSMLGEYRRLAEAEGAALLIVSDHGFRWREGRPERVSSFVNATAAKWHRDEGIYLLWGPGVATRGGPRGHGRVDQVAASVLALLGLPPAAGIAPPLDDAPGFTAAAVDYRAAWHRAEAQDEGPAGDAVEKLRALGYIGGGEPDRAGTPTDEPTRTAGSYDNEGLILRALGRQGEAQRAFEHALAVDPASAAAMWNLSELLLASGQDRDHADDLLVRALAGGLPDGVQAVIGRALAYQRGGDAGQSLKLLGLAIAARPEDGELRLLRARFSTTDCHAALADLIVAQHTLPGSAEVWALSAAMHLCLGEEAEGRADIARSLALDPDQPTLRRYFE